MIYGRGYRNQEGGLARLAWESDGRTLSYQGERIRVEGFQRTAQAAVAETERLLDKLMGGRWAKVKGAIRLRDIADNLVYKGPGRSFVTNRKNAWLKPGAGKIAKLVGRTLWREVKGGDGEIRYECRRQRVEDFIANFKQLRASFSTAAHMWLGQPGRGPEMITLKHCDIEELAKNVFIFDGQVMTVIDRDKSKGTTGRGRLVVRFLPEYLSLVMVAFIV